MTEETPIRRKALFCDDCNAAVRLARKENHALVLTCACGTEQTIKVATALKEAWSA